MKENYGFTSDVFTIGYKKKQLEKPIFKTRKDIKLMHRVDLTTDEDLKSQFCALDVSEMQLRDAITAFPNCPKDSRFAKSNLKYLDLSNNELEELPEIIGELKSLKKINISDNNFDTFPHVLKNFIDDDYNLQHLYFGRNPFLQKPDETEKAKNVHQKITKRHTI